MKFVYWHMNIACEHVGSAPDFMDVRDGQIYGTHNASVRVRLLESSGMFSDTVEIRAFGEKKTVPKEQVSRSPRYENQVNGIRHNSPEDVHEQICDQYEMEREQMKVEERLR